MRAPTASVLDEFEDRLGFVWARDGIVVDDIPGTARLVRELVERDGTGSPAAAAVLAGTGIRRQWNERFAGDRARRLASWLLPHLVPPVVDVLGGDFTVLKALIAAGLERQAVVGCERLAAYGIDRSTLDFLCRDLGPDMAVPHAPGGTALVSAVLHHEPSPIALLEAVASAGASRWVVVENCLDDRNGAEFHLLIDEFFNRCLNGFDVPCVRQHRTAEGWRAMLSCYGEVTHEERCDDVPGIPFPYTLFVVELP